MMHPFLSAMEQNRHGILTDDQRFVLRRFLRVRLGLGILTFLVGGAAIALAIDVLLQGTVHSVATFTASWFLACGSTIAIVWSIVYVIGIVRIYKSVQSRPVRMTRGVPTRHRSGMPRIAPVREDDGKWHLRFVVSGWIEVGDAPFGVLPSGLFQIIRGYEEGIFYYISVRTFGFRRYLIVNYERTKKDSRSFQVRR